MRRNVTVFSFVAALCLTVGVAKADGDPAGECHMVKVCTPKKLAKKKAPPPVADVAPAPIIVPPPVCPPVETPVCEKPAPEVQIVTVTEVKVVKEYMPAPSRPEYVNVGLGIMSSAIWPKKNYAWAWGPALQLRFRMAPHTELVLDGGLGAGADGFGWSPGKTRAWMFQAAVAHYLVNWFAITGGAYVETIGNKPGWERGGYVGFTPGVVFRKSLGKFMFRAEATGFIGGTSFQTDSNIDVVYGMTSSGFISYTWN